jgi:hypothetical protein
MLICWPSLPQDEQGRWNKFGGRLPWDTSAICNNNPTFGGTGNHKTGEDYTAAPNIDHTQEFVRRDIIQWLKLLRSIGFDGFRFDFVKGYSAFSALSLSYERLSHTVNVWQVLRCPRISSRGNCSCHLWSFRCPRHEACHAPKAKDLSGLVRKVRMCAAGGEFVKEYLDATVPQLAFGEYWDTCEYTDGVLNYNQDAHRQRTVNWCDRTGGTSAAFDFTTKGELPI